jgi:hypothetical protein
MRPTLAFTTRVVAGVALLGFGVACGATNSSAVARSKSARGTATVSAIPATPTPIPTPLAAFVDTKRRFSIMFASVPSASSSTSNGVEIDSYIDGRQEVDVLTYPAGYTMGSMCGQAAADAQSAQYKVLSTRTGRQDGFSYCDALMAQNTGGAYNGASYSVSLYSEERIIQANGYYVEVVERGDTRNPPDGYADLVASLKIPA